MASYVVLWKGSTNLSSNWSTRYNKLVGPSTGTSTVSVQGKAIPSWAKSVNASVSCKVSSYVQEKSQLVKASLLSKLKAGDSSASVQTSFKAKAVGEQGHLGTQIDLQVRITYTDGNSSGGSGTKKPETSAQGQDYMDPGLFPHHKQVAYIVDKDNGCVLNFDGVMKVTFSSQVDIQDDTSNQKKKQDYVNNAKDAPDQITLQIVQSQVYTNMSRFESGYYDATAKDVTDADGNVTGKNWAGRMYGQQDSGYDRSRSTYQYLYALKQSRRQVALYTRLKLFDGFVLKSLTANLSEQTTNGWTGQLVFHEYVNSQKKSGNDDLSGTDEALQSMLYRIGIRIPGKYGC